VSAADRKSGGSGAWRSSGAGSVLEAEADRAASVIVDGGIPGRMSPVARDAGEGRETGQVPGAGEGRPLAQSTRRFFEGRFGADLSKIRIHVGARSAASAAEQHARAYTKGRDIVFGAGEYQPDTREGRQLLAHELAHSVQQSSGGASFVQRKLKVGAGLSLDTKGFSTTKAGDVYSAPKALRKSSLWNEIFTSLLASPRIFQLAGKTSSEVDQNLTNHMVARKGIVDFAANKKYKFGAGANFKMNPAFWVVTATGFHVKPGVDEMEAIKDINNPKNVGDPAKEYRIACLAATKLTMVGGAQSGIFDYGSSADKDDWVPGDWGYITNIKFPAVGGIPGLEGENIIYTGGGQFWGHFNPGLEYKTLDGWIAEVNSFTPPTEARLEDQRTSTQVGLL
jgi:hypothetical protein